MKGFRLIGDYALEFLVVTLIVALYPRARRCDWLF